MTFTVSLLLAGLSLLAGTQPGVAQTGGIEEQIDAAIERARARVEDREALIEDPVARVLDRLSRQTRSPGDVAQQAEERVEELIGPFPAVEPASDPLAAFGAPDREALGRAGIAIDEAASARFGTPVYRPASRDQRSLPRDRYLERLERTFAAPPTPPAQPGGVVTPNTGYLTPPGFPRPNAP